MTGRRAILVIPRRGMDNPNRLSNALDQLALGGYELVAVVDPDDHVEALRMVLDGMADLLVITEAQHFPIVQFAADLNGDPDRRARPVLRPQAGRGQDLPHRREPAPSPRPRLIGAQEEVSGDRTAEVERRPVVLPREQRTREIRRTA
jgi:hypothetical protein